MKTRLFYFFIFIFSCFPLFLQGKTADYFTLSSFAAAEKYITADTLVILDLDHTIFEGVNNDYGHGNWFYDRVNKGMRNGLSKKEAIEKFYAHWLLSQRRTAVKPVEPTVLPFIKSLQEKKIPVIGLTSRQTKIAHITLAQLKSLNVNFGTVLKDDARDKGFLDATLVKESVIFCSDYNDKGRVLLKYLTEQGIHSKRIVFIDDEVGNLLSVKKAYAHSSTEVIALHYPVVEQRKAKHWDAHKAEQAYLRTYLEDPVLPPYFVESVKQVEVQHKLLAQNAALKEPYEFRIEGRYFTGLPEVFSPKVFGEDNTLQKAIPLPEDASVLEIGPATGHFVVLCALHGAKKVVAVDISPQAVENTKINASRYDVSHIVDARCGDIFSPLQANEKFDVIFWDIPLNHREQPTKTLLEKSIFDPNHELLKRYIKEADRYLNKDGRVYLSYSSSHGDEDYLIALADHYHWQLKKVKEIGNKDTIQLALYSLQK